MDWRRLLDPAGPLPRSVYWLRRGSLALVAIFVVALVAVLVGRGGSGKPAGVASAPSTTARPSTALTTPPTTSAAPTSAPASATSSAAAAGSCPASALSVVLVTSAKTYGASGSVGFTATLHSTEACAAVGPLVITVRSGDDRIWGSTDCAPADPTASTAVTAGGTAAASRTWSRQRTRPGCATVIGTKTATAGQYVAVATWAGATSAETTFALR